MEGSMWQTRAFKLSFNIILTCVICLSITAIPSSRPVMAATTYIVNSTLDNHDGNPSDGICETVPGNGICTLRAAIENATSSNDIVHFSGTLSDYNIPIHEPLVVVDNGVTIDGYGHDVTIDGSGTSGGDGECLRLSGNYDLVESISIKNCSSYGIWVDEYGNNAGGNYNTIYNVALTGNTSGGIHLVDADLDGYGGNHNVINTTLIGSTTQDPTSCIVSEGNGIGILLAENANNNLISHNFIFCNKLDGIYNFQNFSNHIHGNNIGGNLLSGIYLSASQDITIDQNFIGNKNGTVAFGNAWNGIEMYSATAITIGGASTADANVISGNGRSGIYIYGSSNTLTINNNEIGIGAYLDGALPNGHAGIAIVSNTIPTDSGFSIVIGDDDYITSHQYISGNSREGIYIESSNNIRIKDSNLIGRGNFSANPEVAVGNGLEGVRIYNSPQVTVGGYAIAYNGAAGVKVDGDSSQGDWLHALRIYSNGGLPIDLVPIVGHNPNDLNDSDAGPNTLLNYPVVTEISGGTLSGTACAACRVYIFLAKGDPSRPGGGYVDGNLGFVTASDLGSFGIWSIPYPINGTAYIQDITMISLHVGSGNSSECSPRPEIYMPLLKK
jgi:CSLREA domain-containing protein